MSAKELGIILEFHGNEEKEYAVVSRIDSENAPALKEGDIIVRVDKKYYRPAEVETLLGDSSMAKKKLGWTPKISIEEMISEMVSFDLNNAKKIKLLQEHGLEKDITTKE